MRLGYIIIYVSNVPNTVAFYETAFALTCRFIHESRLYAKMETGSTTLAFAGNEAAEMIGLKVLPNDPKAIAAGWEVCLIANNVAAAYEYAVAKGCNPVAPPTEKPWGQTVSYLRDLNGCLVETPRLSRPKTEMDETTKAAIAEHILEMVAQLAPKATYRSMYGGTVIEMRPSDPKSRVAGVFIYARYVSVEFTKGIFLDDPNQVLEGSGKVRRHIKLHSRGDIRAKQCQALLNKASAHQRCLNPHSLSKRQSQPGKSKCNFSKRASTCHQIPPDRTTMTTSFDHQDQSGNRGPPTKYQYFFNQNPKIPTQRIRVVCSAQHQVGPRA